MSSLRSLNHLLVILTCAASLWAWLNLPDLESYPIHWNIRGEPDGFASKLGVALVLSLMPITAIFTHALLWGLTKVEVVKTSLESSPVVYDATWHACLWLFLAINVLIAFIYIKMVDGSPQSLSGDMMLNFFPIAMGLMFVIIGNVLRKTQQNKFVGIKTPWTLKSKSTWEATHRMTAPLWVVGGLSLIASPFMLSQSAAIIAMIVILTLITLVPIAYSYFYYRSASDKPD